ncbi:hypothetical protein Tco_0508506 [Tanacetum coccineum]
MRWFCWIDCCCFGSCWIWSNLRFDRVCRSGRKGRRGCWRDWDEVVSGGPHPSGLKGTSLIKNPTIILLLLIDCLWDMEERMRNPSRLPASTVKNNQNEGAQCIPLDTDVIVPVQQSFAEDVSGSKRKCNGQQLGVPSSVNEISSDMNVDAPDVQISLAQQPATNNSLGVSDSVSHSSVPLSAPRGFTEGTFQADNHTASSTFPLNYKSVGRTAHEKLADTHIPNFKVRLYNVVRTREYELPTGDMLGSIVYKPGPETDMDYDIIIKERSGHLQRIIREVFVKLLLDSFGKLSIRTYLLGSAIDGREANGIIRDPKLELESSRFTFNLVPLSYESVDCEVYEQNCVELQVKVVRNGNWLWESVCIVGRRNVGSLECGIRLIYEKSEIENCSDVTNGLHGIEMLEGDGQQLGVPSSVNKISSDMNVDAPDVQISLVAQQPATNNSLGVSDSVSHSSVPLSAPRGFTEGTFQADNHTASSTFPLNYKSVGRCEHSYNEVDNRMSHFGGQNSDIR